MIQKISKLDKQIFVEEKEQIYKEKWVFLCLIISSRLVEISRVFKETQGWANLEKFKCKYSAFFYATMDQKLFLKHLCLIIRLETIIWVEIYFLISISECLLTYR